MFKTIFVTIFKKGGKFFMNDIVIIEDIFQSLKGKPADYIVHALKIHGDGDMVDGLLKYLKEAYETGRDELFIERCIEYANGHRDGMFKGTIIGAGGVIVAGAASYGIIKLKKYMEKKLEKTNEEVYSDEL